MRFYFEIMGRYDSKGEYRRLLTIYVGLGHTKGETARLFGFELARNEGKLTFRTWPKLHRVRAKLHPENLRAFVEAGRGV